MKPITLEMQAYGPFKDKVVIDFSDFDGSLFIIHGNTGAGKTTIFDGIVYALYGESSGSFRTSKTMRSDYASSSVKTYVKLTFSYKNRIYTIIRTPLQKAYSQRVKREIVVNPSVELTVDDGSFSPITNVNEATKTIAEILHLTKDEFMQTMMIAQGDFAKLVQAKTDDRQEIYRKILKTGYLDLFDQKLKAKADEYTKQVSSQALSIVGEMKGFQSENQELKDKIASKEAIGLLEDILSLMDQDLLSQESQVAVLNDAKEKAEKERDELLSQHQNIRQDQQNRSDYLQSKAEYESLSLQEQDYFLKEEQCKKAQDAAFVLQISIDVSHLKKNYEDFLSEQETLKSSLPLWEKEAADAQKRYDEERPLLEQEKEKISSEIEEIQRKKDAFNRIRKNQTEFSQLDANLTKIKATLEEENKEKTSLDEQILSLQQETESFDVSKEKMETQTKLNQISTQETSLIKIKERIQRYEEDQKKLSDLQKNYVQAQEILNQAISDYEKSYATFFANQAGILASSLKDNEACPVCGSSSHPKPARLEHDCTITQELLDTLKEKEEEKRAQLTKSSENCVQRKKTVEHDEEEILSEYLSLSGETILIADVQEQLSRFETRLLEEKKILTDQMAELVQKEKDNADRKKQLAALRIKKETLVSKMNQHQKDQSSLSEKAASVRTLLEEDRKKVEGVEESSLTQKNDALKQRRGEVDNTINSIYQTHTNAHTRYQQGLDHQKRLEEKLPVAEKDYHDAEKNLEKSLNEKGFSTLAEAESSKMNPAVLNQLVLNARQYREKLAGAKRMLDSHLEKGHDKIEAVDISNFDNEDMGCKSIADQKTQEFTVAESQYHQNQKLVNALHAEMKTFSVLYKKANDAQLLSDVANGRLAQKKFSQAKKMDFEVYYQSQVFNQILELASRKFLQMTNGRYQLQPAITPDGNAQIGLDINVFDTYTGKSRAVSSISGGESFMASLSLALSLSENIQTNAGGVELDSMFIDEGFGTLDGDSLTETVNVLNSLSGTGEVKRMVGIISHVDSLLESIPHQIEVVKGKEGSKIVVR